MQAITKPALLLLCRCRISPGMRAQHGAPLAPRGLQNEDKRRQPQRAS
jgi:hypothetical protein